MTIIEKLILVTSGLPVEKYLQACVDDGQSARQIARNVGTSHVTIRRLMKKYGIDGKKIAA